GYGVQSTADNFSSLLIGDRFEANHRAPRPHSRTIFQSPPHWGDRCNAPRSFVLKPRLRDELDRYWTVRNWLACAVLKGHRRTSSSHDVVATVIDHARRRVPKVARFDACKFDGSSSAADPIHLQ